MLNLNIIKLINSNAVAFRRDKSILYSRSVLTILIVCLVSSFYAFDSKLLDKGIDLHQGLYYFCLFLLACGLTYILLLGFILYISNLVFHFVSPFLGFILYISNLVFHFVSPFFVFSFYCFIYFLLIISILYFIIISIIIVSNIIEIRYHTWKNKFSILNRYILKPYFFTWGLFYNIRSIDSESAKKIKTNLTSKRYNNLISFLLLALLLWLLSIFS